MKRRFNIYRMCQEYLAMHFFASYTPSQIKNRFPILVVFTFHDQFLLSQIYPCIYIFVISKIDCALSEIGQQEQHFLRRRDDDPQGAGGQALAVGKGDVGVAPVIALGQHQQAPLGQLSRRAVGIQAGDASVCRHGGLILRGVIGQLIVQGLAGFLAGPQVRAVHGLHGLDKLLHTAWPPRFPNP